MKNKVAVFNPNNHNIENFDCGETSLNKYLKERAHLDHNRNVNRTFIFLNIEDEVMGYFTIAPDTIPKAATPKKFARKVGYQKIGVTLLGRLALDQRFHGKGLSSDLMIHAIKRIYKAHKSNVPSYAIVVDPLSEKAKSYYIHFGFNELRDCNRLYITMHQVEELLSEGGE